ncbi:alpha/beta hydrolase fold protein [Rippkaea orientalis PCC 8801]|uniref:Alpha/beta hydrolase fold protein n=1 Tax=Rippkaea orientalis (strain PCC 8801 / RF-1) TaxID=41431 RepID=B7K4U1_RIPO1|nr:alpha/beta hydrolase [Rippkaea orientalis]ACK66597.1 alpha/beta hydrolase fold protein [Rippkaea orientalis PCC 8801]
MDSSLKNCGQEGFVKTNGIQLYYITQGTGKLMLFVHGFPEFWYSWRHQIPEFAQDHKVVALDLRGYNKSDKPQELSAYRIETLVKDIAGVIKELGYDNCILVGHDWGGAIAWYFADAYPGMVEKLIVLNIPHPANFQKGLKTLKQLSKSWYIFFFQIPYLPELILQRNNCQAIATMFRKTCVDKSAFSDEDLEKYKQSAAQPGALTAMLNYYRNIFKSLFTPPKQQWKVLAMPILMIWGENDTALGKELTYDTDQYAQDLTIKYIPNCSHWVQQEKPQLVNQYIREFVT